MYKQRTYLLSDIQNALNRKIEEAHARQMGAVELRVGNDGRAYLSVTVAHEDGSTGTVVLDL